MDAESQNCSINIYYEKVIVSCHFNKYCSTYMASQAYTIWSKIVLPNNICLLLFW